MQEAENHQAQKIEKGKITQLAKYLHRLVLVGGQRRENSNRVGSSRFNGHFLVEMAFAPWHFDGIDLDGLEKNEDHDVRDRDARAPAEHGGRAD